MANDTFIKFGESKEKDWYNRPFPIIEGDSSDDEHYFWTEVQSCEFDMTPYEIPDDKAAAESAESGKEPAKKTRTTLGLVSVSKKVDWGSADLFKLCCLAPEALQDKRPPEKDTGQLETVIIEVCRRSGVDKEGRIPYLTITYSGVYIVSYEISFSGAEPMEKIEFQYAKLEFKYVWMNPSTGGRAGEASAKEMFNHPKPSESDTASTATTPTESDKLTSIAASSGSDSSLSMGNPIPSVMPPNS